MGARAILLACAACALAAARAPRRLANATALAARCDDPRLSGTAAAHCARVVRSSNGVTRAALARGGWLCRAVLVLQSTETKAKHGAPDHHEAIDGACGFSSAAAAAAAAPAPRGGAALVVAAVHHNGLGNQLFQYAFGRLAAWAAGARFAAVPIAAREGPMNAKLPPHSLESWGAFGEIFEAAAVGEPDRAAACAPLTPTKREYRGNGTLLLAERPADTRRVRLASQLEAFLRGTGDGGDLRCVKAIGYWQRYAFFAGLAPRLRAWMRFRPLALTEDPGPRDVVAHVRLCNAPYHFYQRGGPRRSLGKAAARDAPRAAGTWTGTAT